MATETVFVVICRTPIVDRQTNNLTLVEVLEEVNPVALPVLLPQVSILWLLRRDPDDAEEWAARLDLRLNQAQLGSFPVHINFAGSRHFRSIVALQGIVLTEAGELTIEFSRDGAVLAKQSVLILNAPAGVTEVAQANQ